MNKLVNCWIIFALAAAGCSGNKEGPPPQGDSGGADQKFLLAQEPPGARGVIDTRKATKDGDDVVVVGRIGGDKKPWVDGRAAFVIVDTAFKPCNERGDDDCPTPWDYCCDPPDELRKGMATVKFVDEQGKTVPTDARRLLGVKELDTVVVKGKAKRDGDGNLTVLAEALFVRAARK